MAEKAPFSLVSIVGVDGSGKTTLSTWLKDHLTERGHDVEIVWSRFRNYLSKPLLALTRLTGQNYYRTIDGTLFGFHDFERLPVYRELFAALQAVDVNIAAYSRIRSARRSHDIVICERGPWDTLVDVTSDTGLDWLPQSALGRLYAAQIRRDGVVVHISRRRENILETRPELVHDHKLARRIALYERLAVQNGWLQVDNNGTLDGAQQQLAEALRIDRIPQSDGRRVVGEI